MGSPIYPHKKGLPKEPFLTSSFKPGEPGVELEGVLHAKRED